MCVCVCSFFSVLFPLFFFSFLFCWPGLKWNPIWRVSVWLCRLCWARSAGSSGRVFLYAWRPPRFRSVVVNANLSLCRLCGTRSAGSNCWVFLHARWPSWCRSVMFQLSPLQASPASSAFLKAEQTVFKRDYSGALLTQTLAVRNVE